MKTRFYFLLLVFNFCCLVSVWGDSFTIVFKCNSSDGTRVLGTSLLEQVESGAEYCSSVSSTTAYFGKKGILLGSSSSNGKFTLTLNQTYKITNVTVRAIDAFLVDSKIVCGVSATSNTTCSTKLSYSEATDCSFNFDGSEMSTIYVATTQKRAYVASIVVTYVNPASLPSLATPTNLTSSLVDETSVQLSWDAVPNATKYQVTYTTPTGDSQQIETTTNNCTISSLAEQTTYSWSVKAIADGLTYRDSEASSSLSFTTGVLSTYTVKWIVNRTIVSQETLKKGAYVTALPTVANDAIGACADTFMGWSVSNLGLSAGQERPADLFTKLPNIPITSDTTFYAVFATKQTTKSYYLLTDEPADWCGQYLIAYDLSTKHYIMTSPAGNKNTNTYGVAMSVTASYNSTLKSIAASSVITPCQYTIAKTTNGYSILYDKDSCYLGVNTATVAKSGDYLRWDTKCIEKECEWTLAFNNGYVDIRNVNKSIYYLRFATTSTTERFYTYQKDGGGLIHLYRLDYDYADYRTECAIGAENLYVEDWDKTALRVKSAINCDAVYAVIPTTNNGVVSSISIAAQKNTDGSYTIMVPRLDTLACSNIVLKADKDGQLVASHSVKVPIVINTNTSTIALATEDLPETVCSTCDIVIRDKAILTHETSGRAAFRNIHVYAKSGLKLLSYISFAFDTLYMYAENDSVSYAITNNSNTTQTSVTFKRLVYIKRIDGRYWYTFSLPYNCCIADIRDLNNQPLGTFGTDWGIKYYDGEQCQRQATTAAAGDDGLHWKMMGASDTLHTGVGYIIALSYADESITRSIYFTPTAESTYIEDTSYKTASVYSWASNLTAAPRFHGWNFVGSPYISILNESTAEHGLNSSSLKMGYVDALTGEQVQKDNVYISVPDGADKRTYTQQIAANVPIYPFKAYFVQAIDPTDGMNQTNTLTYYRSDHSVVAAAPSSNMTRDSLIYAEITLSAPDGQDDNAGVLVSDRFTADYEIGDDLIKFYACYTKPQLYTLDASGAEYAYQAIPDTKAQHIPLTLYCPMVGEYTIALDFDKSTINAAQAIYLLHAGAVVADLLNEEYTFTVDQAGTQSGYSLDVRRTSQVALSIVGNSAARVYTRDNTLYVEGTAVGDMISVYDILGRLAYQTTVSSSETIIPLVQSGVYTICIGQNAIKIASY